MGTTVQNLNFTRWIYELKYSCPNTFNEFVLVNRLDLYSTLNANRYELALIVEIEPFKGKNTNTKGASLYFRNCYPHDPKDETGLFPTRYENIYFGDLKFIGVDGNQKKVLVLFQIIPEYEQLIIDVFDSCYPIKSNERNQIINGHPWYKKSTPRDAFKVVQNFTGH